MIKMWVKIMCDDKIENQMTYTSIDNFTNDFLPSYSRNMP